MNIQGWDSLSYDEKNVDIPLKHKVSDILYGRLGAARVKGVKDCNLFLIETGQKKEGATRVLSTRYAKNAFYARALVSVTGATVKTRNTQYVRGMSDVILEIVQQIEEKTEIDLMRLRKMLERDFAKLAKK